MAGTVYWWDDEFAHVSTERFFSSPPEGSFRNVVPSDDDSVSVYGHNSIERRFKKEAKRLHHFVIGVCFCREGSNQIGVLSEKNRRLDLRQRHL